MTDSLLDKIELILDKIEIKVFEAYVTLLNRHPPEGYVTLPDDFKVKARTRIQEIRKAFEQTGSYEQLQLVTDRHDDIRIRIYILDQLLDRRIPLPALRQAERDRAVQISRGRGSPDARTTGHGGASRSGTPSGPKEIYLEGGVYAAFTQLAYLAREIHIPGIRRESADSGPKGKANFMSKDISSEMDRLHSFVPPEKIAQSPEEIRRKLEQRNARGSGKAIFQSSELSSTLRPQPGPRLKPEERLKTLSPQSGKGKAVFSSKDISGIATDADQLKAKFAARRPPEDSDKK